MGKKSTIRELLEDLGIKDGQRSQFRKVLLTHIHKERRSIELSVVLKNPMRFLEGFIDSDAAKAFLSYSDENLESVRRDSYHNMTHALVKLTREWVCNLKEYKLSLQEKKRKALTGRRRRSMSDLDVEEEDEEEELEPDEDDTVRASTAYLEEDSHSNDQFGTAGVGSFMNASREATVRPATPESEMEFPDLIDIGTKSSQGGAGASKTSVVIPPYFDACENIESNSSGTKRKICDVATEEPDHRSPQGVTEEDTEDEDNGQRHREARVEPAAKRVRLEAHGKLPRGRSITHVSDTSVTPALVKDIPPVQTSIPFDVNSNPAAVSSSLSDLRYSSPHSQLLTRTHFHSSDQLQMQTEELRDRSLTFLDMIRLRQMNLQKRAMAMDSDAEGRKFYENASEAFAKFYVDVEAILLLL